MIFNSKIVDEFLESIFPLPNKFGLMLCEDGESNPVDFFAFEDAVYSVDYNATVRFGMSKIVIISPKLNNIVIKIPFNGYFIETDEGDLNWYDFCWASGSDCSDYCLAEYEKYDKLRTYELDCFVAKTIYYKTINGVRIFLQEKVIPENDMCFNQTASAGSRNLAKKWYKERKFDIDPEWIANCLDKYGKSKVERFLYYCSNIDLDILEDIHSGNFGYRNNETPCILDYSNFED